jgi:hypothetical protein
VVWEGGWYAGGGRVAAVGWIGAGGNAPGGPPKLPPGWTPIQPPIWIVMGSKIFFWLAIRLKKFFLGW